MSCHLLNIDFYLLFYIVNEVIYKFRKQQQAEKLDTREVLVKTILYTHHLVMMGAWKGCVCSLTGYIHDEKNFLLTFEFAL